RAHGSRAGPPARRSPEAGAAAQAGALSPADRGEGGSAHTVYPRRPRVPGWGRRPAVPRTRLARARWRRVPSRAEARRGSVAVSDRSPPRPHRGRHHFLWHLSQFALSSTVKTTLLATSVFPLWHAPHCSPAFIFSMASGPVAPFFILKTFVGQT